MNSNSKKVNILYFVILPLLISSVIYLFLRPIKPILLNKILPFFNIPPDYYLPLDHNNLFISLIAEYGDFIENKKTAYKGFFNKNKIIDILKETSPNFYYEFYLKSIIRNAKLEFILKKSTQ